MTSPMILYSMKLFYVMTLLEVLARQFSDSSKTTLRQMLQRARVRVNGEIEKDSKRQIGDDERADVAQKSVARAFPRGLALLHADGDVHCVLTSQRHATAATERAPANPARPCL